MAPSLARRAAAEGCAAFALVFAGCGAIVSDAVNQGVLGAVGVSMVFGLAIMAMVYATGHLSGAHVNPAVTLAFAATRHFPARETLAYGSRSSPAPCWVRSRCSPSGPMRRRASEPRFQASASATAWSTR